MSQTLRFGGLRSRGVEAEGLERIGLQRDLEVQRSRGLEIQTNLEV